MNAKRSLKMNRDQLKTLIKECLVELLQDDRLLTRAVNGAIHESRGEGISFDHLIDPPSNPDTLRRIAARRQRQDVEGAYGHSPADSYSESSSGYRDPSYYLQLSAGQQGQQTQQTQHAQPAAQQQHPHHLASDDIMQQIFEDTARTTYREQMMHESTLPRGYDAGARHQPPSPAPAQKLPSNSANWAALAFNK